MRLFDKTKTAVTENLEHCCKGTEEDWGLIITACDTVNSQDGGAKEAARFIRKKLVRSHGDPSLQLRLLIMLKSLAENCGARFQAELASKKFLDDLEQVACSAQTDQSVKQALYQLLQEFADAFRNEPSLCTIATLHTKLQSRHAQFAIVVAPAELQKAQIAQDIELAKNNCHLLIQALSFTDPEAEDITKNELIKEFYDKCQSLQKSITSYLSDMEGDDWLNTLISTNQELLNAFKMYDDMVERGQIEQATVYSQKVQRHEDVGLLIDLSDDVEGAGVGGKNIRNSESSTSNEDPFGDDQEWDPVKNGPSAKALGKLPASYFEDVSASSSSTTYSPSITAPSIDAPNEYPRSNEPTPYHIS